MSQQVQNAAPGPGPFDQFITLMNHDDAKDLVRSINLFMKSFKQNPPDADADSRAVQDFLQQMETAMAKHPLYAKTTPQQQDAATEALEKYLMTKLHERTFRRGADDVERDEALAVRCEALQFVRPEHLEIPEAVVVHSDLGRAVEELNKINKYKAPRDKLVCILNCCSMINAQLARTTKAEGIGADDFTPLLIYVVIKARTPYLASNLAYIERYRYHPKLTAEAQYYYIQLCGAATFIEMINASSLKVDRDEFIAHMLAAGAMTDEQLASLQSSSSADMAAAAAAAHGQAGAAATSTPGGGLPGAGLSSSTQQSILRSTQVAAAAAAAAGLDTGSAWQQAATQQQHPPLQMQPLPTGIVTDAAGGSNWQQQPAQVPQQQQQQQQCVLPPLPSIADLEARGAVLLSQRDPTAAARQLVAHHPLCCSSLDSLSLGDVGRLLTAYKELVLRYEALAAALQDYGQQRQQAANAANAPAAAAAAGGPPPPSAALAATPPTSSAGGSESQLLAPLSPVSAAGAADLTPGSTPSGAAAAAAVAEQAQLSEEPSSTAPHPAHMQQVQASQQQLVTTAAGDAGSTPATGSHAAEACEPVAAPPASSSSNSSSLQTALPGATQGTGSSSTDPVTVQAGPSERAHKGTTSTGTTDQVVGSSAQQGPEAACIAGLSGQDQLQQQQPHPQTQQQSQVTRVDELLHSLLDPEPVTDSTSMQQVQRPGAQQAQAPNSSAAVAGAATAAAAGTDAQTGATSSTAAEDHDLFGFFQQASSGGGSATANTQAAPLSLLD